MIDWGDRVRIVGWWGNERGEVCSVSMMVIRKVGVMKEMVWEMDWEGWREMGIGWIDGGMDDG